MILVLRYLLSFCFDWEDISNTRDNVSSAIKTPRISSKILSCESYFLLSSRCFDMPLKHCLSCLIYYIQSLFLTSLTAVCFLFLVTYHRLGLGCKPSYMSDQNRRKSLEADYFDRPLKPCAREAPFNFPETTAVVAFRNFVRVWNKGSTLILGLCFGGYSLANFLWHLFTLTCFLASKLNRALTAWQGRINFV